MPGNLGDNRDEMSRPVQGQGQDEDAPSFTTNDSTQDPSVDQELKDLQDVLNFGMFDSLTLAKQRLPSMKLEDFDDDSDEEDMMSWTEDNDGKVDFESSLDDVTKIGSLMAFQGPTKRTGVRRGNQGTDSSSRTLIIPTKCHDGPTPYASQAIFYRPVTGSNKVAPTRPMRSPAA